MGAKHAELEVGLRWRSDTGRFDVSLQYQDPIGSDRRQLGDEPLDIDTSALDEIAADEEGYARVLSDMVFGAADIREFYGRAKTAAETNELPLHLRLLVDSKAPTRFHAVRWETLRDPDDQSRIAMRRNILFSRYLSSSDWRPIPPPPKHDLSALVVIADPSDITRFAPAGRTLARVDVAGEWQRAREALANVQVTSLLSRGEATLRKTIDALAVGVDVLYLVCHGALIEDEPVLYLEDAEGLADPIDGTVLVEALSTIDQVPTLGIISSCQSAGAGAGPRSSDEGALAAIGPKLAGAGVAAVVAMQGNVTMETSAMFLPAFFEALSEDGLVDRAVAVARGKVQDRPDWWLPVLFSRLRTGRTWYLPEFTERGAYTWQALMDQIKNRHCTPIIGPGLSDAILGSRQEIASRWVDRWQMPIAPHNREDLAKVAQYLRVRTAGGQPPNEVRSYVMTELRQRYGDELSEELLKGDDPEPSLLELGKRIRDRDPEDPYRALADLPFETYITTSWTRLLEDALDAAGRKPTVRSFDWRGLRDEEDADIPDPSERDPLVYHLFGLIADPDSMVLTEDDYFAWLSAWIGMRSRIPFGIRAALTSRSLLFLGYRLDDWDFRVLFQSLKTFGGSDQLRRNVHVGVQLSPESQVIEPEAAQEYLESYFGDDKVSIYWGETKRFLSELQRRRQTGVG